MKVLRRYKEGNYQVTEYTKDGETVSHVVKTLISRESEATESQPTIRELILVENQYQTALLEIQMLGGI